MRDIQAEMDGIDRQIEELKAKKLELSFMLSMPTPHPDTYNKPFFVIVPEEVPAHPMLEQLFTADGEKYQIDGDDVRLILRKTELLDFPGLSTPIEIMDFMRGRWAYDSTSFHNQSKAETSKLLSMCKSYKK